MGTAFPLLLSRTTLAAAALLAAALALAACNGDDNDVFPAGETLARTHDYEPGRPALVFVYTDG
jgi:hypothetical protein